MTRLSWFGIVYPACLFHFAQSHTLTSPPGSQMKAGMFPVQPRLLMEGNIAFLQIDKDL
jgi:hypothetical protein